MIEIKTTKWFNIIFLLLPKNRKVLTVSEAEHHPNVLIRWLLPEVICHCSRLVKRWIEITPQAVNRFLCWVPPHSWRPVYPRTQLLNTFPSAVSSLAQRLDLVLVTLTEMLNADVSGHDLLNGPLGWKPREHSPTLARPQITTICLLWRSERPQSSWLFAWSVLSV